MAITSTIQEFLTSFDRLSPAEKVLVAREIGRRVKQEMVPGDSVDEELSFLTNQLFEMYDQEEQHHGASEATPW